MHRSITNSSSSSRLSSSSSTLLASATPRASPLVLVSIGLCFCVVLLWSLFLATLRKPLFSVISLDGKDTVVAIKKTLHLVENGDRSTTASIMATIHTEWVQMDERDFGSQHPYGDFAVISGREEGEGDKKMSYLQFLRLLKENESFRQLFINELANDKHTEGYFFECAPITKENADSAPFECVILPSRSLQRVLSAEVDAFDGKLQDGAGTNGATSFPNLSGDSRLVVPFPPKLPFGAKRHPPPEYNAYRHLAAFSQAAPVRSQHNLWRLVADEMMKALESSPPNKRLWLSTSGLGVYYLHVRMDSRPKYYTYRPYRNGK